MANQPPLFKHQKVSKKILAKSDIVFDMSDPGTGKTRVEIEDFASHPVVLVLATKSLLYCAWGSDIDKFAPELVYSIATATNRDKAFDVDADVYITNHDAATWLAAQPKSFWKRFQGGTLVIDESSAFKHKDSQRSKAIVKIRKNFSKVRLLSGTPNTNGICDLWHQLYILDGGKRLGTSFYAFRAAVCEPTQVGPSAQMVKWTDKPNAEATVSAIISDIVIRHKFEDCVDIPANHKYSVPFHLNKRHFAAYKELEAASILQARDSVITAINGAALYTKLLQTASGAVYNDDNSFSIIDEDRYDLVLDLAEARRNSIVFFNWQHQRDLLLKKADQRGLSFALIDGSITKKGERENIVEAYQAGRYKILFAHPQSTAHGLTLTQGVATIWASPTPNLEHYLQGLKRIHRIGQTEKTETIMVVAPGTIEEKVYESLLNKDAKLTALLEYLKEAA